MDQLYHIKELESLTVSKLVPPFPYFGSKRAVAHIIWEALGDVGVYVEPFLGSASILLARPHVPKVETVNDACCFLSNFWRALQHDPAGVAHWVDYPVSELDLHARHRWLMGQAEFREQMRSDPDYYDVKLAGWWVWGLCCWIGHGWCSMSDPNTRRKRPALHHTGKGLHQQRPMVDSKTPGQGLHKKRPLVAGDRNGNGVHQIPVIAGDKTGSGIHRVVQARPAVQGDHPQSSGGIGQSPHIQDWLQALATRLRRVRICCGDWQRVLTPVVLQGAGHTGIVLDPPYGHQERDSRLYSEEHDVAADVAAWAREHGENPQYRIVLCGYESEHTMPGWQVIRWHANGGYGNQGTGRGKANAKRECLWLSPACQTHLAQLNLFGEQG